MARRWWRSDGGVFVVSGLVRLAVVLVLLGIAVTDAISVSATALRAADAADTAATAAADSWRQSHDVGLAYAAARAAVGSEYTLPPAQFVVEPDGSVHDVVHRRATTVLLTRIGPLRHLAVVSESGHAPPATG